MIAATAVSHITGFCFGTDQSMLRAGQENPPNESSWW